MKRIFLLSFFFLSILPMYAQIQEGHVRTAERPGKPSKDLASVTIRPEGNFSPVISNNSGLFELALNGLREGEGYRLHSIRKAGYELPSDAITRTYSFSSSVPLEIVMYNTAELQQEKQQMAERYAAKIVDAFQHQLDSLQSELKKKSISEEDYRKKLADIYERTENYQDLVERMADIYVHTDYAHMDSLDRRISLLIEEGEFEEADRLIRQKGNPEERLAIIEDREQSQLRAEAQLTQVEIKVHNSRELLEKDKSQLETDLFNLYTTALARLDFDEAEKQLLLRIRLYPNSILAYDDMGSFLSTFRGNYGKSLEYLQKSCDLIIQQFGDDDVLLAESYRKLSSMFSNMDNPEESMRYSILALDLLSRHSQERSIEYGDICHDIAVDYVQSGDLSLSR